MPKFPRIKVEHLRRLGIALQSGGRRVGKHIYEGAKALGDPTTTTGKLAAAANHAVYAAELAATGYTVGKLHSIGKRQREHSKKLGIKDKKLFRNRRNFQPVRRAR